MTNDLNWTAIQGLSKNHRGWLEGFRGNTTLYAAAPVTLADYQTIRPALPDHQCFTHRNLGHVVRVPFASPAVEQFMAALSQLTETTP